VSRFTHHVFVCTNKRDPSDPRGCCSARGAEDVLKVFKGELHKRGLKGKVRANSSGCLDSCEHGVSVVVYPEAVWYAHVKPEDVVEIVEKHLIGGEPVARLRAHTSPLKGKEVPGLGLA